MLRPVRSRRPAGALPARSCLVALAVLLGAVVSVTPAHAASPTPTPSPSMVLRVADPAVVEGSGLAVSTRHDGVLYVVNDSGDRARLFAVGPSGETVATLSLGGVEAIDWESLATGPHHTLWVGDIGDNTRSRDEVVVHRIREPRALADTTVHATSYRLRYPDGAHDAEALLVHPRTGRVYVATKQVVSGGLYAAPARLSAGHLNELTRVASVPTVVTGGAFSPDGRRVVLRGPATAQLYDVDDAGTLDEDTFAPAARVALPAQPQGESVTWTRDGRALLVGSEGAGSAVWRVPVAAEGSPAAGRSSGRAGTSAATARHAAAERGDSGGVSPWRWASGAVVLVLVAVAGVALARRSGRGG